MSDSLMMDFGAEETSSPENPLVSPQAAMAASNGKGNGNGKGHVCTDPDEHGPQGNGNGYGHTQGTSPVEAARIIPDVDVELSWTPSTSKPYDENQRIPGMISSAGTLWAGWLPEDNDNKQHTEGDYTPGPYA
ncbi:MAG: hypothetical protein K2O70_09115, partial [Desulfovibrionaceae bacterium]|nr:hypothetical protein [Desulfovibrionaceae bacterium]